MDLLDVLGPKPVVVSVAVTLEAFVVLLAAPALVVIGAVV